MNQATIRALSQVGELVKEEKHDPRQKFIREKDAVRVYCMSRPKSKLLAGRIRLAVGRLSSS